ncbi:ABC transporter substrate-binding protein [Bradyrhizobium sp. AUGA SZCCT0240]|uniref:ABC transporter substrate-binding protein n=1 Tax=unclassified Bradyrhizobium TaxID=2631580 RepID=UPI001BA78F67|nr:MULTISPECIES: ABC transporter substrate-binding protein [unclassified Bradyrhizobium]MBR1197464.1 ABC transporter substrate-binding protein [Bradyrhizobium sp. AUGA SZCCT0158]MBR1254904.1 ABC transporter substrate-binding protein [Bradyrhizobium sp. AUGA SZCCT0240]
MRGFLKVALLSTACAVSSYSASAQTLKLGVLATLSGAGTAWGMAMQGAAELAAEDVNSKGGLEVAGKKYKVEIVAYDDHYKAADALTAFNRMVFDDSIKFVVGPLGSAPALALLPVSTENKVITMTMAFTPKALSAEYKYSFRPVIPSDVFSDPQIKWVVQKLGAKKIGGLFPNDESGQQVGAANEAAYEAVGAKFVAKEFFERERVDFVPLLTRVLAKGIDAFELNGNAPQTAGLLVKQLRELGFKGPIIRTGGDATADILKVAGKDATENVYVHQPINTESPAIQEYTKRFETKYKTPLNAFSPFFYANVQMVFAAMQKSGTVTNSDKVREALRGLKEFETVLGKVNWIGEAQWKSNQQLDAPFYVALLKGGAAQVVAKCTPKVCE